MRIRGDGRLVPTTASQHRKLLAPFPHEGLYRGRSPAADVVLDHPSISRQHAAVCYQRSSGAWMLLDLDSAHGTFLGDAQVSKVTAPAAARPLHGAAAEPVWPARLPFAEGTSHVMQALPGHTS